MTPQKKRGNTFYPNQFVVDENPIALFLFFASQGSVFIVLHQPLNGGNEDHLDKWNQLGEDEPVLDPLDIWGGGQLGQHADQQGGHGQHHREVHSYGRVEKLGQFEEDGDVAQENQDC